MRDPKRQPPGDQTRADPCGAGVRWQTIAFSLENLPVARNRIQSITLVLSDRKERPGFHRRIRLLLLENG
jgi:hypothetical protein